MCEALLALVVMFSLLAVACGGDDDDAAEIDLADFAIDRPESAAGGIVFDTITFLTFPPEMGVCTWETLLSETAEEDFLASEMATMEESVVTAARACTMDEEAIPSLRLSLERSGLYDL